MVGDQGGGWRVEGEAHPQTLEKVWPKGWVSGVGF